MTHAELVNHGKRWLIRNGYNPVFAEQGSMNLLEMPDVIGWKSNCSVVLEIKVSKADFLSDNKKIFRQNPSEGMGNYRYYLIPEELEAEVFCLVPTNWGLKVLRKRGIFNSTESVCFESNKGNEVQFLVSRIKEIQRFGKCLY